MDACKGMEERTKKYERRTRESCAFAIIGKNLNCSESSTRGSKKSQGWRDGDDGVCRFGDVVLIFRCFPAEKILSLSHFLMVHAF